MAEGVKAPQRSLASHSHLLSHETIAHLATELLNFPRGSIFHPSLELLHNTNTFSKQTSSVKHFKPNQGCILLIFGQDVMWEHTKILLDHALVCRWHFEKISKVDFLPWLMDA